MASLSAGCSLSEFLLPNDAPAVIARNTAPAAKKRPQPKMNRKPRKQGQDGAPEKEKDPPKYKVDHMDYYQNATPRVEYPPNYTEEFLAKASVLPDRPRELLWLWEQTEGPVTAAHKSIDVLDMNLSVGWGSIRENRTPTIVSSSMLWVRGVGTHGKVIPAARFHRRASGPQPQALALASGP